jgi:hypothetical protein
MSDLIRQILKERSQLQDHKDHGELHQYIDDNYGDLDRLLLRIINHLTEGVEQNAA